MSSLGTATGDLASIAEHRAKYLRKELAAAPGLLDRIRLGAAMMHAFGELLLNINDELTGDLDVLQPVVNDIIAALKGVQQLNADLQAQIASGADRTLSVDQAAAFATRLQGIEQQMKDAITPAVVTPTPDTPPVADPSADPSSGGTPVR